MHTISSLPLSLVKHTIHISFTFSCSHNSCTHTHNCFSWYSVYNLIVQNTHTHTGAEEHKYTHLLYKWKSLSSMLMKKERDGKPVYYCNRASKKRRAQRIAHAQCVFTTIKIHFHFFLTRFPQTSIAIASDVRLPIISFIDFYRSLLTFDQNTHWLVMPT